MSNRHEDTIEALASLRLEGLSPSADVRDALMRWERGELTVDELDELAAAAAAGRPLPVPATPTA